MMCVKTQELFVCSTEWLAPFFDENEYPWQMLDKLHGYIKKLIEQGIDGYNRISDKVLAQENVKIYPSATIDGYAIIGQNTEIRPGAFLRGDIIIGRDCVVGNSTEMKNCIILDRVQVPHYNYIGDSVLGNRSHLGAGSICSNLKNDGTSVIIHADTDYDTGRRKVGAFLADGANVGCSSVLNPGTVIGRDTWVYPLNMLRGVYPHGVIVKEQGKIVKKKHL